MALLAAGRGAPLSPEQTALEARSGSAPRAEAAPAPRRASPDNGLSVRCPEEPVLGWRSTALALRAPRFPPSRPGVCSCLPPRPSGGRQRGFAGGSVSRGGPGLRAAALCLWRRWARGSPRADEAPGSRDRRGSEGGALGRAAPAGRRPTRARGRARRTRGPGAPGALGGAAAARGAPSARGGSAVSVRARGFPRQPAARPAGRLGRKRRSRLPAAARLFPPPLRGASFVSAAARLFPRRPAARSAVPAARRALGGFRERSAVSVRAAARSALAPWLALLSRPLPACRRAGSACVCVSDAAEV